MACLSPSAAWWMRAAKGVSGWVRLVVGWGLLTAFSPCATVVAVIASEDEGGVDEVFDGVVKVGDGGVEGVEALAFLVFGLVLGLTLLLCVGILVGGELGDGAGAEVVADDTAVDFAGAIVVLVSLTCFPAHAGHSSLGCTTFKNSGIVTVRHVAACRVER